MIRNSIQHFIHSEVRTPIIQSIALSIKTKVGYVTIASIYCPPSESGEKITQENFANYLASLGDRFIVGGDFNAKNVKWGSRITLTRGRALDRAVSVIQADYASSGNPTHYPVDPNKKPDVIDFFVTRKIALHSMVFGVAEVSSALDSDHTPINLDVANSAILKIPTQQITNKKTNWKKFREELNNLIKFDPSNILDSPSKIAKKRSISSLIK